MKNNTALKVCLLLIASVFIIHQLYSSFYKPITTQSAEFSTAVQGLNITGIFIRNETLVENNAGGVLHFVADEGSRVAKDGVIASIYETDTASLTVSQIEAVKRQIADIEDIQSYNNLEATDLDLLNNKVEDGLNALVKSSAAGNFSGSYDYAASLLSTINRRQMATGVASDFSVQLAALNSRLAELNASLPAAKGYVNAAQSGYFVSVTDGYEKVLKCDDLSQITPEFIKDMQPDTVGDTVIGKIVSDYEWYIAAKVTINESLKYKEGDSLTIRTAVKSCPDLSVTVKKINISDNSSDAVLIFACDQMNSEIAAMRSVNMEIISSEYSGLKVSKSALRVIDSKTGVYVLNGMQLKFVPVNVLYSNDAYIICEQQKSTDTVLRLYDEVIVKGKNLYDGKIVG